MAAPCNCELAKSFNFQQTAGQASGLGTQPIGIIGAVSFSTAVAVQVVVKKNDKAAGKAVGKAVGA